MSTTTKRITESYTCAAISTGNLTEEDALLLKHLANTGSQQILQRESGFFIKLIETDDSAESCNLHPQYSPSLLGIIDFVYMAGARMIEFDKDAKAIEGFPVFEW
ncbi:DUF5983 family protein [Neptunomonas phycophila]|uniref:DUF5983 family protein n=1 Tax=Neptunomonas phycophila TaxID=1572645 RepID=UPI0035122D4A